MPKRKAKKELDLFADRYVNNITYEVMLPVTGIDVAVDDRKAAKYPSINQYTMGAHNKTSPTVI